MTKRLLQILLGVSIGLVALQATSPYHITQAACPGDPWCKAYAVADVTDASNYTAIQGWIEYATPTIRDGGFSAEALWIGDWDQDYIEIGWRKTNDGKRRMYWGYVDSGGGWHGPYWLGNNTRGHAYQIEHKQSDNKWHVYIDGVDRGSATLGVSQGTMSAGGEVTDFVAFEHNAMGVSGLLNLSYMRNHTGYWSWNGWSGTRINYSYLLTRISNNAFQNSGYNP